MNGEADILWWLGCLIASAVGMAMLYYAARQKDTYSLIFGLLLSALPMFISTGILMAVALIATVGLFVFVKKNL